MLAIVLIPVYTSSGDSAGSAYRQYLEQNGFVLAAMAFTLAALFGPKVIEIQQQHARTAEGLSHGYVDSDYYRTSESRIHERLDSRVVPARDRATASARRPRFITSLLWRGGPNEFRNLPSSTRNLSSSFLSSELWTNPTSEVGQRRSPGRPWEYGSSESTERERRDSLGGRGVSLPVQTRETLTQPRASPAFIHFPPPPPSTTDE